MLSFFSEIGGGQAGFISQDWTEFAFLYFHTLKIEAKSSKLKVDSDTDMKASLIL